MQPIGHYPNLTLLAATNSFFKGVNKDISDTPLKTIRKAYKYWCMNICNSRWFIILPFYRLQISF